MNDGKRADNENRFSLSPVTVSSSSDQSKHSSISPPKLSGSLTKSVDGAVRFPLDHRQSHKHPSDLRRPRNMFHTRKYRSRSHSRGKSPPSRYRSRSRSRSLPKRYRSRSRSRGRVNRNRRSRSRSKSFRNRRSRSRSQGRQYRNRRSRSRSSGKAGRNRRSRSRSSSYSKSSNRRLVKSRSRSREHSRKKYRSRSPSLKSSHRGESVDMRSIWETFQAEVSALESLRVEEERLYDRDPEKHPDYKLEWKKFYKGRVQEILDCGDDPKLHNFESEWAYFWKFRMSDLINMDYEKKKVALKRRLKLPEDAEMPLYLQVKESKNAVLDSGMPPSHANALSSSKRVGISKGLISTLRIVTAVEEQLGSLGPRVNGLLSEGVSLQRISGSHPDSLLSNPENFVLLETVKEKLLGQIQSNIVKKSLEAAVEEAISSIDVLLKSFAPPNPLLFHNQLYASGERSLWPQGSTNDSQMNVPGVGEVDRVAIAQQIADALIKQGKTDVTEAELQELVNGVVGMVEAQAAQERERQMASQKERLPMQEPLRAEVAIVIPEEKNLVQETPVSTTSLVAPSEIPLIPDPPVLTKNPLPVVKESDALNMLMSVVKSGIKKTNPVEKSLGWSSDDSDEPFTIKPTSISSQADKNPANDSVKQDIDEKLNVKMEFTRTTETIKNAPSSERQGISTTVAKKETPKWYSQARKSPSPEIFKSMKKKVLLAAAKDRRMALQNKSLSPFSSREETSNPLPNSEEEDEDLKVIGAWDSDSDIDLDSFGKTKGLAYDKVNVKRMSPDKYEKNLSLLNKSKEVLQSTVVAAPRSVGPDINLDAAIDNLMGELKNKTSKIEVISSKSQTIVKKLQNISPTKMVGQPSKNGQSISSQTQQMPSNKVVTTQGYHPPYCYPQAQSYGVVQQGYYSNSSVPSFTQSGSGVPYYASNQGATTSAYYNNSGNLVYCPTNAQWQNYYSAQQANIPSNLGSGTNYGKY